MKTEKLGRIPGIWWVAAIAGLLFAVLMQLLAAIDPLLRKHLPPVGPISAMITVALFLLVCVVMDFVGRLFVYESNFLEMAPSSILVVAIAIALASLFLGARSQTEDEAATMFLSGVVILMVAIPAAFFIRGMTRRETNGRR